MESHRGAIFYTNFPTNWAALWSANYEAFFSTFLFPNDAAIIATFISSIKPTFF
jgi:hypothetical protein